MIKTVLVAIVAVLHVYFLILEMFLWTKPAGLKAFRMNLEKAKATSTLAANQGLYNGFLAAGLVWSLLYPNLEVGRQIGLFFLSCVIVAAVYGAFSVSKKIFLIQGLPAILAVLALVFEG
jgi:putative membrane protein